MTRRAAAALILAALAFPGCRREAAPPQDAAREQAPVQVTANPFAPPPPDESPDRINLLNFAHGAAIVSRSGETSLLSSAVAAIDGDPSSTWVSLPKGQTESLVASLPSRSRIERVGYRTVKPPNDAARVTIEASLDGKTFQPLATVAAKHSEKPQLVNVTPTEAAFVRVTMTGEGPESSPNVASVYAQGAALEPVRVPPIGGCWTINQAPATFMERGGRTVGVISTPGGALRLDGGSDGRVYRFAWTRNREHGVAMVSLTPDGQHVSGEYWHEEPIPLFFAEGWLGERTACTVKLEDHGDVAAFFLHEVGRYPLFGVRFDTAGRMDLANSVETLRGLASFLHSIAGREVRIVAHEFRNADSAKNRAAAETEIAAVRAVLQRFGLDLSRVQFVAAGDEHPRQKPVTEAMRALYSSVDVEIRR